MRIPLGFAISKRFNDGRYYTGQVVSGPEWCWVDERRQRREKMWHVRYDADGQTEDLTLEELQEWQMEKKTKKNQRRTKNHSSKTEKNEEQQDSNDDSPTHNKPAISPTTTTSNNMKDEDAQDQDQKQDASGAPQATATHTYLAKDGLYYTTYENMAKANKALVEKRIQSLGLDQLWSRAKTVTPSPRKTTARSRPATTEPARRSKRIRKEPAPFVQELFADAIVRPRGFHQKEEKKKKKQHRRPVTSDDINLLISAADRAKLTQMYPDNDDSWLDDMEHYLAHDEQVSEQNYRSVMRQVEKLCTGVGITYHHWPKGVYFAKGDAVNLGWNMQELYVKACEYETKYGRDLGNGWLVRHPIKKMHNFQHYLLHKKNGKGK